MTDTAPKHPAKFSAEILPIVRDYLVGYYNVLDPMAGVGTLAWYLREYKSGQRSFFVWSNDIEQEWAKQAPAYRWTTYDAQKLPELWGGFFDAVATSCTYGNRMADHHEAKDASKRHTYRHYLGRPLTPGNTGAMQWGPEYRETHEAIWRECWRVLRPGGRLVLNVSDHIRAGRLVSVTNWHIGCLMDIGFKLMDNTAVSTKRQRHGANGTIRVDCEWVLLFEKPE